VNDPHDPERRYLEVEMPDWFVLEFQLPDGTWMDEAFCTPEHFGRNDDGSYLRSDGGSGLWIRAVHIDEDGVIHHVDGGGEHYRYRLAALPNERYSLTERDRPIAP
jgi:hypothetical protein